MPPAGFTEQMLLLERLIKAVVEAESVGSSENGSKMYFDRRNAKNIFRPVGETMHSEVGWNIFGTGPTGPVSPSSWSERALATPPRWNF